MRLWTRLLRLALCYAFALMAGFLLYLALIRTPLLAGIDILFYRGVLLAILAALLLGGSTLLVARLRAPIDLATGVGAVVLSLSFNICFLVLGPVTIDRSISIFLLARVEAANVPPTEAELQQLFVTQYLGEMRQIHRRVEEQTVSGNLHVVNGRISLTPRGQTLIDLFRQVGGWFATDPRFVGQASVQVEPVDSRD